MPEIAEVLKAAKWLQRHMGSYSLHSLTFTPTGKYRPENGPPARYEIFKECLPASNLHFEARGKKILCSTTTRVTGSGSGSSTDVYMIIGLGMSGKFRLLKDEEDAPQHSAYIFTFRDTSDTENTLIRRVAFIDHRHFACLHLFVGRDEYEKGLKKYAPSIDPLSSLITVEEWTRLIRNPRRKNTLIISFLLDQKSIGGIGNYLSAEILFACRISPSRVLGEVTDQDILRLKTHTERLVKLSYESNGNLVYTKAETGPGKGFRCYVYGCKVYRTRSKDGCIKTYEVIGSKIYGTRTTYWCPEIQV